MNLIINSLKKIFPEEVLKLSLLFAYVLIIPTGIILWANHEIVSVDQLAITILYIACEMLFFIVIASLGNSLCNRMLSVALISIAFVWTLADLFCFIHMRTQLLPSLLFLVQCTEWNERSGFLKNYLPQWSNLIFLIYPMLGLTIFFKFKKHFIVLLAVLGLFIPPLYVFAFSIAPAVGDQLYAIRALPDRIDEGLDMYVSFEQAEEMLAASNSNLKVKFNGQEATFLLIIGESHSKLHSELYGYARPNNPLLKKRYENAELFVFRNAVAPHAFTMYSVPKLLSLEAHDVQETFVETPNIFDIASSAGFKTWWICNHHPLIDQTMNYAPMIRRAGHLLYASSNTQRNPDGALLPLLDAALNDPAPLKLIVCQLIGSHHEYDSTYTADFARFPADSILDSWNEKQKKEKKILNDYDNSILYNDFILDSIIGRIEKLKIPSFMLYVPDHGENLYENDNLALHMEFQPTRPTVEVPLYIYLNPEMRKHVAPEKLQAISEASKKAFATEDTPFLFMDIAEFQTPVFQKNKSPLAPDFMIKKRLVSRSKTDYELLP